MRHVESLVKVVRPLQARICQSLPTLPLPDGVDRLVSQLRGQLKQAKRKGLLRNSHEQIDNQYLKCHQPIEKDLYERERLSEQKIPYQQTAAVFGGGSQGNSRKNMKRDPSVPHFARDDGAWFDFSLTLFQSQRGLELLAYDYEIRFPSEEPVQFLRFDLNGPVNPRKDEMRCHLHPSSDDDELSIPAPILTPGEMLDFLIYGLRSPEKPRHRKGEQPGQYLSDVAFDAIAVILKTNGIALNDELSNQLITEIQGMNEPDKFARLIERAVRARSAEDILGEAAASKA